MDQRVRGFKCGDLSLNPLPMFMQKAECGLGSGYMRTQEALWGLLTSSIALGYVGNPVSRPRVIEQEI